MLGCGWEKENVLQNALACVLDLQLFCICEGEPNGFAKIVKSFILSLSFNVCTVVIGLLITKRKLSEKPSMKPP
jgi:hypothetical protein